MNEEQIKLFLDNERLITSFIKTQCQNSYTPRDELRTLCKIGLVKAVKSFKEGSSKFSTWAYHCMKNEVLHSYRYNTRGKRKGESIPFSDIAEDFTDDRLNTLTGMYLEDISDLDNKIMIHKWFEGLSKRDKLLMMTVTQNITQRDAARILKVSQAQISRLSTKLCNRLKEELSPSNEAN